MFKRLRKVEPPTDSHCNISGECDVSHFVMAHGIMGVINIDP